MSRKSDDGREPIAKVLEFVKSFVVGYEDLLKLMLVAVLTKGHILIEGVPGTGKTTIAKLFAMSIGGTFKRVQMAPDLLPADILGSYYFDIRKGEWVFRQGPVFAKDAANAFLKTLHRVNPNFSEPCKKLSTPIHALNGLCNTKPLNSYVIQSSAEICVVL
jgi:MoxR-like ATPase